MDRQEREARAKFRGLSLKQKLEYIWDYYKVHIICTIVAVIVVVSSVIGYLTRPGYDFEISMYSLYGLSDGKDEAFCDIIEKYSIDTNGDGRIMVNLIQATGEITNPIYAQLAQVNLSRLQAELISNQHSTLLVDEAYKQYLENDHAALIKSIIDISENEEVRDALNIVSGSGLYLITMEKYGDAEKNEGMYKNSLALEEHFIPQKQKSVD